MVSTDMSCIIYILKKYLPNSNGSNANERRAEVLCVNHDEATAGHLEIAKTNPNNEDIILAWDGTRYYAIRTTLQKLLTA